MLAKLEDEDMPTTRKRRRLDMMKSDHPHSNRIVGIRDTKDGRFVFSLSSDKVLRVWDAYALRKVRTETVPAAFTGHFFAAIWLEPIRWRQTQYQIYHLIYAMKAANYGLSSQSAAILSLRSSTRLLISLKTLFRGKCGYRMCFKDISNASPHVPIGEVITRLAYMIHNWFSLSLFP